MFALNGHALASGGKMQVKTEDGHFAAVMQNTCKGEAGYSRKSSSTHCQAFIPLVSSGAGCGCEKHQCSCEEFEGVDLIN